VQQKGGGFPLGGNGAINTQSTAWGVEGLLAAGANPAEFKRGGASAYEYLEANQVGDGHYRYSSGSDQTPVWVTAEVLVAAARKHLPLEAVPRAPRPKQTTPTPVPSPTPDTPLTPLPEEGSVTPVPLPTLPAEGGAAATSPSGGQGGTGGKPKRGKGGAASPGGIGAGPGGTASTPPIEATPGGVIPEDGSTLEPKNGEALSTGVPAGGSDSGSGSGSSASVIGSIVAGFLAGGILFGIGYGPYKRWQETRRVRPTPPPRRT
jgi:hypothetical protein